MNLRQISVISAFVLGSLSLSAVPAKPGIHKLSQPDGTVVEAYIYGDEHFRYYETLSGEMLMLSQDGYLRPMSVEKDGTLVAKGEISGNPTSESDRGTFSSAMVRMRANAMKSKGFMRVKPAQIPLSFPTTGEVTGLVILCNYQDVKFTPDATREHYDRICNERGYQGPEAYGSVIDYFSSQSNGQFTPKFDVFGPVTLPYERAHYGTNDDIVNQFRDACLEADKLGLDFSKYDINDDGFVDFLFVLFAGHGEAQGGPASSVWPAMQDLSDFVFDYFDGLNLGVAACSCELKGGEGTVLDGVGTICHEFSHILGLADIYDTSYQGGHGMSHYDLMDIGTYNDNQITPSGYTAMDKYTLGWIEPIVLEESQSDITLEPFNTSHQAAFIVNPDNSNEYYTLENRQQQGWDGGIPGHGLVISYCHYDPVHWRRNTVNAVASGYEHVRIVAADNLWVATVADEANDPYPGAFGNTSFSASSLPAAKWHSATAAFLPSVSNIRESENGTITFDFTAVATAVNDVRQEDIAVYVDGNSIVAPDNALIFDISGRRVERDNLSCGVYIVRTPSCSLKVVVGQK